MSLPPRLHAMTVIGALCGCAELSAVSFEYQQCAQANNMTHVNVNLLLKYNARFLRHNIASIIITTVMSAYAINLLCPIKQSAMSSFLRRRQRKTKARMWRPQKL